LDTNYLFRRKNQIMKVYAQKRRLDLSTRKEAAGEAEMMNP
jgi:hypothetical protein